MFNLDEPINPYTILDKAICILNEYFLDSKEGVLEECIVLEIKVFLPLSPSATHTSSSLKKSKSLPLSPYKL